MNRRVETTPKQQLAELRQAYERYAALAEQLKDSVDSTVDAELQRSLARDACRIAAAYKKSVDNNCARIANTCASESNATRFAVLATGLTVAVAIIAGGALTITVRPELVRLILPGGAEPAITANSAVATKEITPYVPAEVKPDLVSPAPERVGAALGPAPTEDGRESVATVKSGATDSHAPVRSPAHKTLTNRVGGSPVASASAEAAPPVNAKTAAAAPGVAASKTASATSLSATPMAAMSTQQLPSYPTDTNRAVGSGITQVQVSISVAGAITDCRVVETSGSPGLDASACSLVERNWQGPPLLNNSRAASGTTNVSVVWNLGAAK
jgi:periplasmic protein TonB